MARPLASVSEIAAIVRRVTLIDVAAARTTTDERICMLLLGDNMKKDSYIKSNECQSVQSELVMSNWRHTMPTAEAYGLNKVLFQLHHQAGDLLRYQQEPDAYLDQFALSANARRAILQNDVAQLYLLGCNPYLLRAHCIGMRIPEAESLAALRSAARS
jgi:protocatechuate 4,5-dioxygenase alpha chain